MKGKLVAVLYNKTGKCVKVLDVKTLDEKEYKRHLNETYECMESDTSKIRLESLEKTNEFFVKKFGIHDLYLAKSVYDNFVDRGLIEDDKDFQKDFYDMVFNGKELEHYPEEFVKILTKVSAI